MDLSKAISLARQYKNSEVSDLHLTLSLLLDFDSECVLILKKSRVVLNNLATDLENEIRKLKKSEIVLEPICSTQLNQVFLKVQKVKQILLAILLTDCQSSKVLKKHGVSEAKVREIMAKIKNGIN